MASPQGGEGGGGGGGGGGNFQGSGPATDNADSGSGPPSGGIDTSSSSFVERKNILIAHAVLACVAWAFFSPIGAVLLRLNINHPIMLKLHIFLQMFVYVLYLAATALGIWFCFQIQQYVDIWSDPHIIIGLIILAFATIQPVSGWIHHRIFHSRAVAFATTNRGPRPGRTIWGRVHLWLGRVVITLGVINGGLGLRLMETSPTQDPEVTRDAEIGYGIAAGLIWCVYVGITVVWEVKRSARMRKQHDGSLPAAGRAPGTTTSSSDSSLRPELKQAPV